MAENHYCKKCGCELKPGDKFCKKCGTPVSPLSQVDTEVTQKIATRVSPDGPGGHGSLRKWLPVLIIIVAVVIVLIVVVSVVRHRNEGDDLYRKYGIITGMDFSDADVEQAARDMYVALYEAAYSSHDEYADLIIGGTDDEIEGYRYDYAFSSAQNHEHMIVTVVLNEDPYYLVQVDAYTPMDIYKAGDLTSLDQKYLMSYTDDGWKINMTSEAVDFVDSHDMLMKRYPEDVVNALEAGRNAKAFDRCYLWLNQTDTFEDILYGDVLFLWQNDDGSADAMLWLGDGETRKNTINGGTLNVTDEELGTVLNCTFDLDERINAESSELKTVHINAEDVETGTSDWTEMTADITLDYDPDPYIPFVNEFID